ncbi:MAG: biotin carboxylase [Bacteroidota bacterium]|nr:biotin carboxylase [Bacteroidota bacterium]
MSLEAEIAHIRSLFKSNTTPIYFISATNFNLLGMDEWISNFKFICHIDSFEGAHPNVLSPSIEIEHEEFQSIEDINNYLLQHPEVINYIKSRSVNGNAGKVVFLMFDSKTEQLAKHLGLEVCMPSANLREYLDNKVNTNRVAEKAGVACVPYVLSKVNDYKHLRQVSKDLGEQLVVQTPYGDSGHTTFFVSTEADFELYKNEITAEKEVKIMKRINCYGTAIEGCVTSNGTIVGPLMTELVGFKELTPYKGGWCGNELFANAFTPEIREKAHNYTQLFGNQLLKEGYKGYFELDFLIDKDNGAIYLGELNPRFSGVSSLTNHGQFAYNDVPLFLFHLLEWINMPYHINIEALNQKWNTQNNIDSWSQLVIKHTKKTLEFVIQAPQTGIWEIQKNGKIKFEKTDFNRLSVLSDNTAFFMQITQKDGYMYEGADLGILVMRGRQMYDDFTLSERAKRWIAAIRSNYQSEIIDGELLDEAGIGGDFKVM